MQYPIHDTYPATYRDEHGEERTTIHNDGQELRMVIRGVTFTGSSPDDFEPVEGTDPDALVIFTFNPLESSTGEIHLILCACEIEYEISLPVVVGGTTTQAPLFVRLVLGKPKERGHLDQETLYIELRFSDQTFRSRGISGLFENEMLDIQKALPEGVSLKACIICAFSDYSPLGN